MNKKAYLMLANGNVFEGRRFGAEGIVTGELVFTTGMIGYMEAMSEANYCNQIVLQTFPMVGNYGVMEADMEHGRPTLGGYVVREWCRTPSNFRSEGDIDAFLKKHGVPGIYGLDTRAITRMIREQGVMNARITDDPSDRDGIKELVQKDAVAIVGAKTFKQLAPEGDARCRVALLDYGAKRSLIKVLQMRGCEVVLMPYDANAEDVVEQQADGVLLSNGPGDPNENAQRIHTVEGLLGKLPICGIDLGHQLLALAAGGKTVKLKYGHRGANQPVKDLATGRVYITSQNHGYAVIAGSATEGCETMVNVNDGTCEGMDYLNLHAFSVQFFPEAPDTQFLLDRFINLMEEQKHAAQ